jgi:hypothetical protein
MSVTLLIISSVPMSAMAAMCDTPVQTSAHDDMTANMGQGMAHEDEHVQHEHSMALNSDWQRDRIECGCGCHNSIDSLPHLFAPHMTSDTIQIAEHLFVVVPVRFETAWLVYTVRVPLPPPQV